jgi:hypothetical protein
MLHFNVKNMRTKGFWYKIYTDLANKFPVIWKLIAVLMEFYKISSQQIAAAGKCILRNCLIE